MSKCRLYFDVEFNDEVTHPEGLANAFDRLLETVMGTPGILGEYDNPTIGPVLIQEKEASESIPIDSQFIQVVTVTDPDTQLPVDVEIRKLETGPMVGFDGSFLAELDEEEQPFSPYDVDDKGRAVPVIVPDDEDSFKQLE